jgi:hypothetical protein
VWTDNQHEFGSFDYFDISSLVSISDRFLDGLASVEHWRRHGE